jgi:hypothetical protein
LVIGFLHIGDRSQANPAPETKSGEGPELFHHARSPKRERFASQIPRAASIKSTSGQGHTALEYHGPQQSLSVRSALKRGGYDTEASMINLRLLGMAAILSAATAPPALAQAMAQEPLAYASNETATRPWSVPVGRRQPRSADIPASTSAPQQIIDQEDAIVDRKIRGICRGC